MRFNPKMGLLLALALSSACLKAPAGDRGDDCSNSEPCRAGLSCVDGTCRDLDPPDDAGNGDGGDVDADAGNDACGGACSGSVCDPDRGECVGCLTDIDCAVGVCDVEQNSCVECVSQSDCQSGHCTTARQCVECLEASHCEIGTCDVEQGACVECLDDDDCADGVCDEAANQCHECLADEDCAAGVCDETNSRCVGCLQPADCNDVTASVCDDATDTCMPCAEAQDCAHIAGRTLCDGNSVCVECLDTVGGWDACGANSCDPVAGSCTQTLRGSVDVCEPCQADSECADGYACVPLEFQGTPHGTYCLKLFVDCPRPYGVPLQRTTVNGVDAQFCGIDESATTCQAVRAFGLGCVDAEDCAAEGAICGTVNQVANTCTYSCASHLTCDAASPCGNARCGG